MKKTFRFILAILLLIGLAASAAADVTISSTASTSGSLPVTVSGPVSVLKAQNSNPQNSSAVSAANSPVSVTISGTAGKQIRVYSIAGSCASTAAISSISITDGGNQVFSLTSSQFGGVFQWATPLTSIAGNTVVVTYGACSTGTQIGTLNVQADKDN